MKVTKGKFGRFLEIDLNKESEEFFKFLEDTLRILAGSYLNEKPWNFKFHSREYGPFHVIHCKIYSSCQLVDVKVGELLLSYCEMKPYHASAAKPRESHSSPTRSSNDIFPVGKILSILNVIRR